MRNSSKNVPLWSVRFHQCAICCPDYANRVNFFSLLLVLSIIKGRNDDSQQTGIEEYFEGMLNMTL